MGKRLAVSLLVISAASLSGQQREVRPASTTASLVQDTTFRTDDSPLVRAAKRTLAARKGGQNLPVHRVTDATLKRGGRVAFASGPVNGPTVPPLPEPEGPPVPQALPDRTAETQQRIQALQQEQRRMRDEADEGPYGEIDEDVVERRLTEIPNEMQPATPPTSPPDR
jgi:hypothetical protein